ncbi:MAG: T9SS type A sorting domain-containing protein [Saprospiraceae bacterium]|nr:T9SS type A sorting domain-containing protein [Saprospiraceae bacterium]
MTVSCTDSAAQLSGDPGYTPMIIDSCNMDDIPERLMNVTWPIPYKNKCESDTSHIIMRMWNLPGGPTLCTDTIYVIRINLDSIVCATGVDSIYCGDTLNAIDSLSLRAPRYVNANLDSFDLLSASGDLCDVQISHTDTWWPSCGNTGTVLREWNIHACGEHIVCLDTLVLLDTLGPDLTFDLKKEIHSFLSFGGEYYTDTIGTGASCFGQGLAPYATAQDACSDLSDVTVQVELLGGGILHEYTGDEFKALPISNIPPEKAVLIYKSRDACWNYTFDTVVLVVADQSPANAACHAAVNLSLTNVEGLSLMKAGSMDADSYDNCGIYKILARRMDWMTACGYIDDTTSTPVGDFYQTYKQWVDIDPGICQDIFELGFAEEVPFCCEDVGKQIKVEIVVIDNNCNVDRCWGYVNVEDKVAPQVIQPLSDISLNCAAYDTYYPGLFEFADTTAIQAAFGMYVLSPTDRTTFEVQDLSCDDLTMPTTSSFVDGLVYDNCGSTLRERYTQTHGGCANSTIKREFIALVSTNAGVVEHVYATQYIYLTTCLLDDLEVSYPVKDTTIFDCGVTFGLDGNTTIVTQGPSLPDNLPSCSQFGMGYFDKVFDIVSGVGCKKVQRTWCVVDWCQVTFRGAWSDMVGKPGVVTFNQYIKVMDTIPPTLMEVNVPDMVTSSCAAAFVGEVEASDGCGQDPTVSWYLRQVGAGVLAQGTGEIAAPADLLLPGNYQILWSAKDNCNNVTEIISTFSVTSDALPGIVNHSSLTTILTPMDSDNDGINDFGMGEIWADEFNSSSSAPCGGSAANLVFLLEKGQASDSSSVPPLDATSLAFFCSDFVSNPTAIPVQFWVVDTLNNTADYSNAVVMLYDNHGICNGTATQQIVVTGSILTENSEQIANVEVKKVNQDDQNAVVTSDDGRYQVFHSGTPTILRPEKDTDHGNGVSTADLIRLQKHILDIKRINSPYGLIAADVNGDKKLNPIDMIQMRRVILGKEDRFPSNTSWRFVDADYRFKHHSDALAEDFPEQYELHANTSDHMYKDFIGLKVGDLNGNVFAGRSAKRSTKNSIIKVADHDFAVANAVSVPVYIDVDRSIEGMQLRWSFDIGSLQFTDIVSGQLDLTSEMLNIESVENGLISLSWTFADGMPLVADKPLFTLRFIAQSQGKISKAVALERTLEPEMYDVDDETIGLSLQFEQSNQLDQTTLYQNRPNPFRESTTIEFYMSSTGEATITVFDASGRQIKQVYGHYAEGNQLVQFAGNELTPGVLYYQLKTATGTLTKKMVLLR